MRRAGLHWIALSTILVVAFSPALSNGTEARGAVADHSDTITGFVAPTFDEATHRQSDTARSMREPTFVLWLVLLGGTVALGIQTRRFRFTGGPSRTHLTASVSARGCRAPPTASV